MPADNNEHVNKHTSSSRDFLILFRRPIREVYWNLPVAMLPSHSKAIFVNSVPSAHFVSLRASLQRAYKKTRGMMPSLRHPLISWYKPFNEILFTQNIRLLFLFQLHNDGQRHRAYQINVIVVQEPILENRREEMRRVVCKWTFLKHSYSFNYSQPMVVMHGMRAPGALRCTSKGSGTRENRNGE